MNRQRRRFLGLTALASATFARRTSVLAASGENPPSTTPQRKEARPGTTTIRLNARLRGARDGTAAGQELTYGEPFPVLRLSKGSEVSIELTNAMPEPTSLDWHGMRLPNRFEVPLGSIEAFVAPGGTARMAMIPGDSGSFWFHPAAMPGFSDQTSSGLSGAVIVADPSDPPVDADKVLFLTDARLGPVPGQPAAKPGAGASDGFLVNGRAGPETEQFVPGARVRLRVFNASTRRAVSVTFGGARAFVIAIDGQPSELFSPLNDSVPMGPGARFDIMVDLPRSSGADFKVFARGSAPERAAASDGPVYVAATAGSPRAEQAAIGPLARNPTLPLVIPLEHSTRVDLAAQYRPASKGGDGPGAWAINGVSGRTLAPKPLFSVKRGTPVTLGFSNKSPVLTSFRLHGHAMRLLHRLDDGWEPYWRDSVLVPPGATHHAAFLADNPGRWLIESPFFDQAANGLRTWFEVA